MAQQGASRDQWINIPHSVPFECLPFKAALGAGEQQPRTPDQPPYCMVNSMLRFVLTVLLVAISLTAQTIVELPYGRRIQVRGNCVEAGGVPQTPPQRASFSQQDYVELTRSACYGVCPAYRVRIYRSGQVEWEGRGHVEKVGTAENQADMPSAVAIFTQAASTEFWAACDSYHRRVTDNPTYTVTASIGGKTKSITDYAQGGPDWVRELMQKVDEAAGSQQWGGPTWYPIEVK